MPSRIEDYVLIGDCQTAALVARNGSIDWLCFPRFDSGACFAALLGTPEHGRWQLTPVEQPQAIPRHYWPGTLILETEYETDSGVVAVIDWMPPRHTTPDVMRLVVGRRGTVPMRMELVIRFDYGSVVPWVQRSADGIRAIAGPDTLYLHPPFRCTARICERLRSLPSPRATGCHSSSPGRPPSRQFPMPWRPSMNSTPRPHGGEPGRIAAHIRAPGVRRFAAP
jgi:hypothetical protein